MNQEDVKQKNKKDYHYKSEVLTRRVSTLLDDLSLFASRIVFLRDVSPPFSGKIFRVHIVAKREGKKNGLVSVQITSAVKNELV